VAGCCECGDEPSGSCATELVSLDMKNNLFPYIPAWRSLPTLFPDFSIHELNVSISLYLPIPVAAQSKE
jgi:hypothetical protein